jgi:membrane protease YdiL (CAAX protease family)
MGASNNGHSGNMIGPIAGIPLFVYCDCKITNYQGLMQYRSNKGFTGAGQLGVLIGVTGAGLIALSVVQMLAAFVMVPRGTPMGAINDVLESSLKNPANVGFVRLLQAIGTLLIFFLPAVVFSGITNGWNRIWLGFHKYAGIRQFLLGFALIFLANIVAVGLDDISRFFLARFPSVDKMALDMENAYNETVKIMGLIRTWPELIIAIIIMAFLPAVFEETYFRGAMQRTLEKWWHSPVAAIVTSSLIFSLVHFSIYLFFSRFFLGLALGIMFYLTRNIWVSIVAHFLNNAIAVVQLYLVSRGKKEVDVNELSPDYDIWIILSAFIFMFLLVRLLDRFSSASRVLCEEEERFVGRGTL